MIKSIRNLEVDDLVGAGGLKINWRDCSLDPFLELMSSKNVFKIEFENISLGMYFFT